MLEMGEQGDDTANSRFTDYLRDGGEGTLALDRVWDVYFRL